MISLHLKDKKGFSLLELLLVLAIIAALIVSAFIIFPQIKISQEVSSESKNISVLRSGLASLYQSTQIPNNIEMNQIAINADVVPYNMLDGTTNKIRNVWGGDVYVGSYYMVQGSPILVIQYNHVPADACAKLVMGTAFNAEQVVVGKAKEGDTGGIIRNGQDRNVVFGAKRENTSENQELTVSNVTVAYGTTDEAFILYKFIP